MPHSHSHDFKIDRSDSVILFIVLQTAKTCLRPNLLFFIQAKTKSLMTFPGISLCFCLICQKVFQNKPEISTNIGRKIQINVSH